MSQAKIEPGALDSWASANHEATAPPKSSGLKPLQIVDVFKLTLFPKGKQRKIAFNLNCLFKTANTEPLIPDFRYERNGKRMKLPDPAKYKTNNWEIHLKLNAFTE